VQKTLRAETGDGWVCFLFRYFGRNWSKQGQGSRIFELTSIGVATISNRCRRLANEFTNFTAQTRTDVILEAVSCYLKISFTVFGAWCYASAGYAVMRCPSVHLFVTFVNCVKTNKYIFKILSPSGSQTIWNFPYQTAWQYSDAWTP